MRDAPRAPYQCTVHTPRLVTGLTAFYLSALGLSINLDKVLLLCFCSMSAQMSFQLNSRININGYKGTIKYIGAVDGTTGTWLGVEWDERARGKHSGEKDGKSYFQCRSVARM